MSILYSPFKSYNISQVWDFPVCAAKAVKYSSVEMMWSCKLHPVAHNSLNCDFWYSTLWKTVALCDARWCVSLETDHILLMWRRTHKAASAVQYISDIALMYAWVLSNVAVSVWCIQVWRVWPRMQGQLAWRHIRQYRVTLGGEAGKLIRTSLFNLEGYPDASILIQSSTLFVDHVDLHLHSSMHGFFRLSIFATAQSQRFWLKSCSAIHCMFAFRQLKLVWWNIYTNKLTRQALAGLILFCRPACSLGLGYVSRSCWFMAG